MGVVVMSSLVLDLQKEAMDSEVETSGLLRKAYVVARKLKIKEFEEWIELELNGYIGIEIPPYRRVRGQVKYLNPFHGYQDYLNGNERLMELLSTRKLNNSISELEDLYKNGGTKPLLLPIPTEVKMSFVKQFKSNICPEYLFITTSTIKDILDAVKKIILDWALKLEEDGILGDDLQFTIREKEIAEEKSSKYNMIFNDSVVQVGEGNIQNVNQINLDEVSGLLTDIKDSIRDLELDSDQAKELTIGMDTIESQISLKQPNQVIIKESLISIKSILEGCAGSLIASGLMFEVTKLIGI